MIQKDFDALLADILTDYRNQRPDVDLSQGSVLFIKAACLASALWGAYQQQAYIARQIFPDTADTAALEHHAWEQALTRRPGESDASLLERLLAVYRTPPAGGNRYDYVSWALSVTNVARAWCIPNGQGAGTVDVLILASSTATGSEIPSAHTLSGTSTAVAAGKLVDAAANYINASDPVRKGDIARNAATGASAVVTAIDSATQLSLAVDIFPTTGQAYTISSLCQQVRAVIEDKRPVGASIFRVLPPTVLTQDLSLQVIGAVDKAQLATDLHKYREGFIPGQTLYLAQISALALAAGASDCIITTPASNVTTTAYQMIRPGATNVT